jgi:hypothetical protein
VVFASVTVRIGCFVECFGITLASVGHVNLIFVLHFEHFCKKRAFCTLHAFYESTGPVAQYFPPILALYIFIVRVTFFSATVWIRFVVDRFGMFSASLGMLIPILVLKPFFFNVHACCEKALVQLGSVSPPIIAQYIFIVGVLFLSTTVRIGCFV